MFTKHFYNGFNRAMFQDSILKNFTDVTKIKILQQENSQAFSVIAPVLEDSELTYTIHVNPGDTVKVHKTPYPVLEVLKNNE